MRTDRYSGHHQMSVPGGLGRPSSLEADIPLEAEPTPPPRRQTPRRQTPRFYWIYFYSLMAPEKNKDILDFAQIQFSACFPVKHSSCHKSN